MSRAFFAALFFTTVIELPFHWRALAPLPRVRRGLGALAPSLVTLPIVWSVIMRPSLPYWHAFALSEIFAVAAEALLLRLAGGRRPLAFSFMANATSATAGLLWHAAG